MIRRARNRFRIFTRQLGYAIARFGQTPIGIEPTRDYKRYLNHVPNPILFDVGANVGQTTAILRSAFPKSVIHSFEPSPRSFDALRKNHEPDKKTHLWNLACGSSNTHLDLLENDHSKMTSFLKPSKYAWGKIIEKTSVEVKSIDTFSEENSIDFIHLLKTDTQGYDFEVLKGANRLMRENRIGLVYFEFTFSQMYEGLPDFSDVYNYLSKLNFALATYYEPHVQDELIGWTDFLFINRDFHNSRKQFTR